MMFKVAGALALTSGFIGQSSTKCLMPQSAQYLVKGGSPGTVCLPLFGFGQSLTQCDHHHNQNMVLVVVLTYMVWVLVDLLVLPSR